MVEEISLRRFLGRRYTTELLNNVLDSSVIKEKNMEKKRKREKSRIGFEYDCDIQLGKEQIWFALEVFGDS